MIIESKDVVTALLPGKRNVRVGFVYLATSASGSEIGRIVIKEVVEIPSMLSITESGRDKETALFPEVEMLGGIFPDEELFATNLGYGSFKELVFLLRSRYRGRLHLPMTWISYEWKE